MNAVREGFAAGYECLSAWSDLLDRINVFPVADGDTGANLRISLAPFRDCEADGETTRDLLARCATGNSGNIAAAFFREFCQAECSRDLGEKAELGREKAWQAVARPYPGTMLSVFDSLAGVLEPRATLEALYPRLLSELQQTVFATSHILPDLKRAGVVDSGALGMFVFFDGFFKQLTGQSNRHIPLLELFDGKLAINSSFRPEFTDYYCVDAVINTDDKQTAVSAGIAELGESLVVLPNEAGLKIHIHTPDPGQLRAQLGSLGEIVHWSGEPIDQHRVAQFPGPEGKQAIHVMTDAAGSITREMARQHSLTLLDSYIIAGGDSRPESLYPPAEIYSLMRKGRQVTTAQASTFERHQHYQNVCGQFGRTLYLCVGSAFTGNYATAMAWKEENDQNNLLEVMDTGAASGRLGLIALLTARHGGNAGSPEEIIDVARKIIEDCMEYVFIDELKYLVAGGRVSRAGGFFGDLLHMKPIISPTSDGVRKVGVVRGRKGQLSFALERLGERFDESISPVIMLQYSDNEHWVAGTVQQQVRELLPEAEILLTPLSLTSGVHMGPGTWSMAFASAS